MKHENVSNLPGLFAFVGIVSTPFFLRTATLLILVGLLATGFYAGSPALSSSERSMKEGSAVSSRTAALDNSATRLGAFMPSTRTRRYASWPAFPLAPLPVTVETFASNCKTPKTLFSPGDTVCAQVVGAVPGWQLIWSNARSVAVQTNSITAETENISFTLRSTASLGDWRAIVFDQVSGSINAVATFTVADSQYPVVEVQVSQDRVATETNAGARVVFGIQVANGGPDAAAVQLTNAVPASTTFMSFAQLTGPVFGCTSPIVGSTGTSVCTIARLGRREVATFLGTYLVDAGVSRGTDISNTATVTVPVDVVDSNSFNDSSSASVPVVSAPCVLACPANITVAADPGQSGALVTYSTPTSTGNCGQPSTGESGETIPVISCNPTSGSFFGVGTTTVTCAGQTGEASGFQLTVENPGGLSIALNGPNSLTVECGADFTDPGASAVNRSGQSVPVVITLPQGFNADAPAVGSYTLTYTATEAENSTSTTRTVNVTDTAGPQITLAGQDPMTVPIGQTFVDPGVSASDSCEGSSPVNSFGTVDTNTPGTYTIMYTATDSSNHTSTKTRKVIVKPGGNTPPTLTLNGVTPSMRPPNHSYNTFNVADFVTSASDNCDASVDLNSVYITRVTSDEAENSQGDGSTLNDIIIAADCKSVQLRSERDGDGDGRVYTITFKVSDASGNFTIKTAKVFGPKSQNGNPAVESGPPYTVNSTCPYGLSRW